MVEPALELEEVEHLVQLALEGAEDDVWRADDSGRAGKDADYLRGLAMVKIAREYGWRVY